MAPLRAQAFGAEAPPYIPTPDALVDLMLDMADVGPGDLVYDLGSGDGRLVIAAALRGARSVGIEFEEGLVTLSRARADSAQVAERATFIHGDIFESDVSDADVVMLYLSPEFNLRLRPLLMRETSAGTRVVSHAFHMGDWEPDTTRTVGSGASRATVFGWIVPARVDGFWLVDGTGFEPFSLELVQEYQHLSGNAWIDGGSGRVSGRVRGDEVEITMGNGPDGRLVFSGRIADGRIVGAIADGQEVPRPAIALRFSDPARAPLP